MGKTEREMGMRIGTYAFNPPITFSTWSLSLSIPPTALSPKMPSCLLTVVAKVGFSPTLVEERRSFSMCQLKPQAKSSRLKCS